MRHELQFICIVLKSWTQLSDALLSIRGTTKCNFESQSAIAWFGAICEWGLPCVEIGRDCAE